MEFRGEENRSKCQVYDKFPEWLYILFKDDLSIIALSGKMFAFENMSFCNNSLQQMKKKSCKKMYSEKSSIHTSPHLDINHPTSILKGY